jgi:hypothetical protein
VVLQTGDVKFRAKKKKRKTKEKKHTNTRECNIFRNSNDKINYLQLMGVTGTLYRTK